MQRQLRSKILKLVIGFALLCGHCAVGQSEVDSVDPDLRQIRETFGVPGDNSGVLKVTKKYYGSEIEGIYVREPYLYADRLCVFERHTKLGTKVGDIIEWRENSESVGIKYWFATPPGHCEAIFGEEVPNAVHVNDPIDIDSVLAIMDFERGLIQQAIARPDGARFGEWMDSRLVDISLVDSLQDLPIDGPFFGAMYSLPSKVHGPVVYFRDVDGRFQIEKVSSWMF